jgi:antitoxin (DNA-binding transcriptional repressor) of toxin-antitoxin stability system
MQNPIFPVWCKRLESGAEAEFIIARNGQPAARLVPLALGSSVQRRIGVARGQFAAPAERGDANDEAAALFRNVE